MTEFDLIPQEYRLRLAAQRWLRHLAVTVGLVVAVTTAGGAALAYANGGLSSQIQALQTHHAMTTQHREQLESLDGNIAELRRQWQLLITLRSGAPAENVFVVIDAALTDGSIWLQDWSFKRAGSTGPPAAATVNTGYFVVVPEGETSAPRPAWKVQTHVTVRGQARNHAALSAFARRLFSRAEVGDVRVQRAALRRYVNANVVDFELAILLDGPAEPR